MNTIIAGVKREYWEHKNIIVSLPLAISVLGVVVAIFGLIAMSYFEVDIYGRESMPPANQNEAKPLGSSLKKAPGYRSDADSASSSNSQTDVGDSKRNDGSAPAQKQSKTLHEGEESLSFEAVRFFIGAAWLVCFYYLFSCLYADRKDKSLLFWKSLPVSETQNVLTKLLVGCVGFVAVYVVFAWLTGIFIFTLAIAATLLNSAQIGQGSSWAFSAVEFFILPLVTLVIGFMWGAPLFAYVLMVSAVAKRSPFMLLILPPLILIFLENTFISSNYIGSFVAQHLPFSVFGPIATGPDMGALLHYFFLENGLSLLLGLAVATGFIALAIWFRNNRFEI